MEEKGKIENIENNILNEEAVLKKEEKKIEAVKKEIFSGSGQKIWFDKYYKLIMIIPLIITLLALVYLGFFYQNNNHEFILKDVSLSGGTMITLKVDQMNIDFDSFETSLKEKAVMRNSEVSLRKLTDISSGKLLSIIVESSSKTEDVTTDIEDILGYKLTNDNSNIEFSEPSLGSNFYNQLIIALVISFILMSFVIFFLFKTFIPSMAVIFAAFSDIILPLALVNFLGIKLSAAGIAAFLMLVGYSVDTDILLTSRALKKKDGTLNQRIFGAFKTGILMTLTALFAVLPAFFIVTGLPDSFRQIFLILALGLIADIINTWMTNAGLIKWYCERKGIK